MWKFTEVRSARSVVLAVVIVFSAIPRESIAWGPRGHEIVAEIAAQELTPRARAEVETLLGDRASNAMREASTWADEQKQWPGYGASGPLHYVNFPRGTCRYVAKRDCRQGRCAVGALDHFARQLRDGRSKRERADALRWIIHLVADIHQPLHAGHADDRGGNDVQVRRRGEGTNLHRLLDSGLLRERGMRATVYAQSLLDNETRNWLHGEADAWNAQAPTRWIEQSCEAVKLLTPPGERIDDAYVRRAMPILEQRLLQAGHRLATTLNALLDP
jgi:nuclease S1